VHLIVAIFFVLDRVDWSEGRLSKYGWGATRMLGHLKL